MHMCMSFSKMYAKYPVNGSGHRGDADCYEHRAVGYLTNVRNPNIVNPDCCVIRAVFALYPGLLRERVSAIIHCIKNDPQHEQEIRFVDDRTSRRKNMGFYYARKYSKTSFGLGACQPKRKKLRY